MYFELYRSQKYFNTSNNSIQTSSIQIEYTFVLMCKIRLIDHVYIVKLPILKKKSSLQTFSGRIRLFFRNHFCCWVVPREISCWNHPMATRSISSTNRRNFLSTSTLRGAAEEMTDEKEMGFSDGEVSCITHVQIYSALKYR